MKIIINWNNEMKNDDYKNWKLIINWRIKVIIFEIKRWRMLYWMKRKNEKWNKWNKLIEMK